MISNFLLATKQGQFVMTIHANVITKLADGTDPFNGVKSLADDWAKKSIVAGLAVLILALVVTFLVLGFGGEDLRRKSKSKAGWIVAAAIGISGAAGALTWISHTGGSWFGGN